ncbi:MAG TPA: hypothetical protein DEF45_17960 [Rhodopirellula sp.]|nr:hypothetical protein [Rhodopirellula sp.]
MKRLAMSIRSLVFLGRVAPTLFVSALIINAQQVAAAKLNFAEHIAPIFTKHCIRCHHAENRQGDLSLGTSQDLKDNGYIIAGNAAESPLMDLIQPRDGTKPEMPKQGSAMPKGEITAIKAWIDEGAIWPDNVVLSAPPPSQQTWWSYQPLQSIQHSNLSQPPAPSPTAKAHAVDHFISTQLAQQNLTRSNRANRRTLIRRLYFDLHGLPPTPEAVQSFVKDPDPQAYAKLIDQLLDAPEYGERYARHWLDLAHYADTHGFERDRRRDNAWRYRDYVIQAFNDDKPYDLFLQEQIAGDILWPDNRNAVVATGFLTAGPWDYVGHIETKSAKLRRAARSLDLDDIATQVMTSTVAMTINCARCHDHKLDPITQQEYYQLRAVFAGFKRGDRVISDAALKEYQRQKELLSDKRDLIDYTIGRLEGKGFDLADIVGGGNGLGSGTYRHGIDTRSAKVQTRDFGKLGNVIPNKYAISPFEFIDGVFVPDGKDGSAKIPVSSTGMSITGIPTTSGQAWDMIRNGPVASQHSKQLGGTDFTKQGHSLLGLHANAGITFDLSAIRSASKWNEMRLLTKVGYFGADDGSSADAWIFVDAEKVYEKRGLKRSTGLQIIDLKIPASAKFLTLMSTDGGNGFGMDQIGFGDPKLKSAQTHSLTAKDQQQIKMLRLERARLTRSLDLLGSPPRFYGPVAETVLPPIRLLERGDAESPRGPPLTPAAPSALAMLETELGTSNTPEGDRRAALARWVTAENNPLAARVIANRMWQWHFGQGLVSTSSDFGAGGDTPSHPQLLDWLASQLIAQEWSLKSLHRIILLSATYQQQSTFQLDHPALSIDADNCLLWRQNPRRLEAEVIRDSVLFLSGKLNHKRGGPGFEDFRYQDAYAPIYTYVTADKPELWRRSIYRYIVRTTPDRFLRTLDCPDPANLTAKRETTTTPLQSLTLFNNDFMLRQASYFSERVLNSSSGDIEQQVRNAFQLAYGRLPTATEAKIAMQLMEQQGLFTLCRALLNSNEFLYVD